MIKCRSCNGELEEVVTLGDIYINEFRYDDQLPPKAPLNLALCQECSLVQLTESVPPEEMFTDDYGYESGINGIIRDDLKSVVDQVVPIADLKIGDIVIDIACNDGTLLSNYNNSVYTIGVDPVKKFREKSIKHAHFIVDDFFSAPPVQEIIDDINSTFEYDFGVIQSSKKAKIITTISMFYDLEDPSSFCEDVKSLLDDEGVWVVQQNYLGSMLKQNAFCNIVHQHVEYYSLISFTHLLRRHGLRVFHVEENNINGGSFRTLICKDDAHFITDATVARMVTNELEAGLSTIQTYYDFVDRINTEVSELYNLVVHLNKEGKKVAVYGASTRGDTLLQVAQLDNKLLCYAVERNPDKFGKIMSSIQLPIISEEEARLDHPDYMLVLPWFFFSEFVDRESDYLESGGAFILPLPEVRIVKIVEGDDDD